jgi:hypothetical protein
VLHKQVHVLLVLEEVVHFHDLRVLQQRVNLDFALNPRNQIVLTQILLVDDLERVQGAALSAAHLVDEGIGPAA